MNMQRPKILTELLLLLNANVLEVLVAEDNNASLCDQEGKLILLGIVQLRELKTSDLGANYWREPVGLDIWIVLGKKIRLFLIGIGATVVELERFECIKVRFLVIHWEVCLVLVLVQSGLVLHSDTMGMNVYLLMDLLVKGQLQTCHRL